MGNIYFANVDTSEFNRLAEKVFGFKTYALDIFPSNIYNAYTLPIDMKLDTKMNIKKTSICDKSGFKYKKEAGYCCITCISSGLIFSDNFTDGEILAIILHEIGHNFASVVDRGIEINMFTLKYVNLVCQLINYANGRFHTLPAYFNAFDEFIVKLEDDIRKKLPALATILTIWNGISAIASDIVINIFALMGDILGYNIVRNLAAKIENILFKPTAYTNEKIADNFATIYGYGPEISTALNKFEVKRGIITTDTLNEIPVIGDIIALKNLPAEIIISAFDEHPDTLERCMDQVRLLERELKKSNLDPKMKKVISDNIDELKKAQDDYSNNYKDRHNATIYKRMWYSLIFNITDGDLKHHMLGKNNFENIDKALGTQESTNLLDW